MKLTRPQLIAIENFAMKALDGQYKHEQYQTSLPSWEKGYKQWDFARQSATGQMRLLMWYQHTHQPGSQEWRPVIIIQAVLKHLNLPFQNGIFANREAKPGAVSLPAASLDRCQSVAGNCQKNTGVTPADDGKQLSASLELEAQEEQALVSTEEDQDHQEIQESLLIPFNPPLAKSNHRRPGQPILAAFANCQLEPITSLF